jgi:hypothetical protein
MMHSVGYTVSEFGIMEEMERFWKEAIMAESK